MLEIIFHALVGFSFITNCHMFRWCKQGIFMNYIKQTVIYRFTNLLPMNSCDTFENFTSVMPIPTPFKHKHKTFDTTHSPKSKMVLDANISKF